MVIVLRAKVVNDDILTAFFYILEMIAGNAKASNLGQPNLSLAFCTRLFDVNFTCLNYQIFLIFLETSI